METRRKMATAKASAEHTLQRRGRYSGMEYDTSDTESVGTCRGLEDGDDSDYEVRREKVGQTFRKRLAVGGSMTKSNNVTRQPTRRPDPNVSNRNALMARENRKRKKEQMEFLEQENATLHKDLKKLQKIVDRQEVMIRGLRNERNYLKSVLSNQSDIVTLLKRLQPNAGVPAAEEPVTHASSASPCSVYSDSGMSLSGGENSPHRNAVGGDESGNNKCSDDFDLHDNNYDLMFSSDPFAIGGCDADNLMGYGFGEHEQDEQEKQQLTTDGNETQRETIRSEHNYVYPNVSLIPHDNNAAVVVVKNPCEVEHETQAKRPRIVEEPQDPAVSPPGICLHIGGGKVSIEYCAQCHESATREWQVKRL